ncbi:MAG TPA: hypothetical protein PKA20_27945, partial [Burkholderiaceae bacterium]|nr:hypothetical protein [Burkholderiaceae bacterium]
MRSLGKRAEGARLERIIASPRWAGDGFRNLHPIAPGLRDRAAPRPTLRDFLGNGDRRVPAARLPVVDPRPAWREPPADGLRATWLGHSSGLIAIDGLTGLTDP